MTSRISADMQHAWHAHSMEELYATLQASPNGLSEHDVRRRLHEFGRNEIPREKPYSSLRLFLRQLASPLIYLVLSAVALSLLFGHYTDAVFILIVILINTLVGFYQERKANRSLTYLKKMVRVRARVIRDGLVKEVDSEELVAGDVILVRAGDKIPADCRILEGSNIKTDEAPLTGESLPVAKTPGVVPAPTPAAERTNMLFMGTMCESGHGKALVVATGLSTQIGEIVSLVQETPERATPLQKKIASLSRLVGAMILGFVFILIVIGYSREQAFVEIFVAALALAVSAIPEGLLPAITVILVLGMRRILTQKGLVRQLVATETLGSVTVICTDKTGTLTEGNMQVSHILTSTRELLGESLKGVAAAPEVNGLASHILALKIAALTNEAFIENPDDELEQWVVRGRATERALLLAGVHAGLDKRELLARYPVADSLGFDADLRYAATLHRSPDATHTLFVVGEPEELIRRSSTLDVDGSHKTLHSSEAHQLLAKLEELTAKGLRVIACAYTTYPERTSYTHLAELVHHLRLVGFIALKDPLRPQVREAVATAQRAGIRTVIITGDHRNTARTIAAEAGLSIRDEWILEGKALEGMRDEELAARAKATVVYARVSPRHKVRIVNALSANGEVVAMVGDGVNDAPALKAAHIGVAVGSGTDVAKGVADIVLLDDSFTTILKAVEQGRVIFENVRKVFVYLVADDFSELFLFFGSMLAGMPLPLLPAQILWINFVEDGFPNIALTTEQETRGVMDQKPRHPDEPILNRPLKKWMAAIFFVTGIAAFLVFAGAYYVSGDITKTRTMVFAMMALDSLIFSLSVRSFYRPIMRRDIFSNYYLMGAIGIGLALLWAAIYVSVVSALLGTTPLGYSEWLIIVAVSLVEIILLELFKKRFFKGR